MGVLLVAEYLRRGGIGYLDSVDRRPERPDAAGDGYAEIGSAACSTWSGVPKTAEVAKEALTFELSWI